MPIRTTSTASQPLALAIQIMLCGKTEYKQGLDFTPLDALLSLAKAASAAFCAATASAGWALGEGLLEAAPAPGVCDRAVGWSSR